jgi:uncharacterized YccA/Bax inhibitor family protein
MRSSNPVFTAIERDYTQSGVSEASYTGITTKTLLLFLIAIVSGYVSLMSFAPETYMTMLFVSMIIAFIAVIVASRSPRLAMPMSIVYAISEGMLLGFITAIANAYAPGAPYLAVIATGSIFFVMLFLYSSRIIRVTSRFRKIMFGTLIAILIFFIMTGLLSLFTDVNNLFYDSTFGIGLSIFLIVYGALMLTLDFDRAEAIVSMGADKNYEWMVSIGLMVTIIWIYIEILRLIMILSSRRN